MAHYEATVRVFDIVEADAAAARRLLEVQLRTAGFSRWQVVHLGVQGAAAPATRRPPRVVAPAEANSAGSGLFVAAVVAWAFWFLWLLAG
jgi:hypothetical protein